MDSQDMPTLTRERRGAGWRYTISVPKDCRPHYTSRHLRKTVSEPDRLKADEVAHRWAAEIAAEFRRIRETGSPYKQTISNAELEQLVALMVSSTLGADEELRTIGEYADEDFFKRAEAELEEADEDTRRALSRGIFGAVKDIASDWLGGHWYTLPEDSPEFRRVLFRFARARAEAIKAQRLRSEGEWVETPRITEAKAKETEASQRSNEGPTLNECFNQWKRKKPRPAKTLSDTEAAIAAFEEHHGKRGVLGYARRDAITWRDSLLHRETKPLHARTVGKKLSLLRAVVQVAIDDELGGLKDSTSNPFRDTEPDVPKTQKPRTAYSAEQLNALFSSPIYAAKERPAGGRGEAAYWLPLIALFSGARLEEIGQLRVQDVAEERGIPCFFLRPEAGSIKTGEERRVPIHPQLDQLGFLRYVEANRSAGHERVFPELGRGAGGKLTDSWSKWYGRYLREVVKITDKRITFHSFRHTFKDACRDAGIVEEIHDAFTGHKRGGVGRSYGGDGFPIGPLAEAMKQIIYLGVRLPEPWQYHTGDTTCSEN